VVAYDRTASKTIVTRMDNAGTIAWTYQCDLVYTEAPMLLNSGLYSGTNSFLYLTTKLSTGAIGITRYYLWSNGNLFEIYGK